MQDLQKGQQDLQRGQQDLQRGQQDLQKGQQDLQKGQRDIMARIDRLQDTVTSMRSDISVNFGAVQHAERRQDNLREEMNTLTNLVYGMERQIQHIQSELRGRAGE